jgi:hypothetical protein
VEGEVTRWVVRWTDTQYSKSGVIQSIGGGPRRFKTRALATEFADEKQDYARRKRIPLAYSVEEVELS